VKVRDSGVSGRLKRAVSNIPTSCKIELNIPASRIQRLHFVTLTVLDWQTCEAYLIEKLKKILKKKEINNMSPFFLKCKA
jgi:hypothetical protein